MIRVCWLVVVLMTAINDRWRSARSPRKDIKDDLVIPPTLTDVGLLFCLQKTVKIGYGHDTMRSLGHVSCS